MEWLKKLQVYVFVGLLLGAPAALGQSIGDKVFGVAISCRNKVYNKGGLPGHYSIAGKVTAPACKGAGNATASSSAKVGPPQVGVTAVTTRAKRGDGSSSGASSTDVAILTPPNGWLGSVPVELKTVYDFNIQGVVPPKTAAEYQVNWLVTSDGATKVDHTVNADFNGKGEQKLSFRFSVDQSNNAYEFTVALSGAAKAAASPVGGPSANVVTLPIRVFLPQGWTCTWLSGVAGCGP